MSFLEQTVKDYALELHIVENAYRRYGRTAEFYSDLEDWVKYLGSL